MLELNEIYYGTTCTKRTHRLSQAFCKRAKESGEVEWLTEVSKTLQARSFHMLLFTSPHPLTHSLTHHPLTPRSHTTLTHTLTHTLSHTLTHTLSHTLTHALTHTTPTHTLTYTLTHTCPRSPPRATSRPSAPR